LKFSPFDANTQCLVRQEAGLLNEKLKMILFFFLLYIYLASQGYLSIGHPTIRKIHND